MTIDEAIEILKDGELNPCVTEDREACDMAIKALEQESCEDIMTIHTQGLDEGIRCAMCTNSMKSDRGCDGGCVVNEAMYKEVMNTIRNHINAEQLIHMLPSVKPQEPRWIPVSERLPEEYGEYLITWTTSQSERPFIGISEGEDTLEYDHEHNRFKFEWLLDDYIKAYPNVEVIAWMPLPEPYKGE